MLIELGRREITSAVVLAHGGPGLSLLEQHLVDRIVTSSRAEIPGGFSVTSSTREPQTYFVAGRDDRGE
jgi:riboflavin biosynthesis pyrimidine reductase